MRVQLIGGTRFIGPNVIKHLLTMGHEVSVFHRGENSAELPSGVNEILGNRDSLEEYKDQFKQFAPDVVLDMFPYIESDALKLVSVFEGMVKRIVALSSLDIYRAYERLLNIKPGPIEPTPIKEDDPLREGLYPLQFLYGENDRLYFYDKKIVEKIYLESELPCTILRLPQVYGPGDRQHRMFPYLKRIQDGRKFILLGDQFAKWKVSRGYVEDIAYGIALAVSIESNQNRIYNVCEQNSYTELEWVQLITKTVGWDGEIVIVPEEELNDGMNSAQHWTMDTSKIREELGYKELTNHSLAIQKTLDWEMKNPAEKISLEDFNYEKEDKLIGKYVKI